MESKVRVLVYVDEREYNLERGYTGREAGCDGSGILVGVSRWWVWM